MCLSSAVLKTKKITTCTNFYKAPGVQAWGVDDLTPDAHSCCAPSASSTTSTAYRNIDREDPVSSPNPRAILTKECTGLTLSGTTLTSRKRLGRRIVEANFVLDSGVNLSNSRLTSFLFSLAQVDRGLHAALDKYAFFSVTGSLNTLKQLVSMLEKDNDRRQVVFDTTGFDPARMLDLQNPAIANPQYGLVALRAEHMLPMARYLSRNLTDPRFPPFSFGYHHHPAANLNPFLVILNAERKFRRYLRQQWLPPLPLPTDVMTLIHLTIKLVKMIYWDPAVRPNTYAQIFNTYPLPAPELQPMSPPSDAEMGHTDDECEEEVPTPQVHCAAIRRLWAIFALRSR
ncbi:hypothetical protein BYT27DRAFT_7247479 [Phlegmacium glaucopus]|nr:hypothetical protein BYT27DRAFT_7247479 [Phlegmacium glaucopus]